MKNPRKPRPHRAYGDTFEEKAAIDRWVVEQLANFPEPSDYTKNALRRIINGGGGPSA